ncbi:MAG: phosphoribosyl-AMP cyclohydrolase [Candidatus Hodarchaeota archaeon]
MRLSKILDIENLKFGRGDGLIPVVVQDCISLVVLELAHINKEALQRTINTKYAHYYDQAEKRVIKKGNKFGNVQRVQEILVDCTKSALIFQVVQKGLACQFWMRSCFHI